MNELFGATGGLLTQRLGELGVHLHLLGAIALFFGALRFLHAGRTTSRLLLALGCGLYVVGVTIDSLELLGLYEQRYYPGWKSDGFVPSSDGEVLDFARPRWWEGLLWWLARLSRLAGLLAATAGFVMEGRSLLRGGAVGRRRRA